MSPIDDDELDRLADYVAGLLDPTEAARVRELVDTDPAWARAYTGLVAAGPRLDAHLAGLADAPMPGDVAERLRAVLALQSPPRAAGTGNVVRLSARRRWTRGTAGVAAVAAAVSAIFLGIAQLSPSVSQNTGTSSGGAAGSLAGPNPGIAPFSGRSDVGPVSVTHSGTDYTPLTLPGVSPSRRPPAAAASPAPATEGDTKGLQPNTTGEGGTLDRLAGPVALHACLLAIAERYGGQPTEVDYALFEGSPALVVVLSGGTRRVVVAGPACGQPGGGIDERYAIPQ